MDACQAFGQMQDISRQQLIKTLNMHKSKRWPCHSQDRLMLRLLPMRSGDALPDAVVVFVVAAVLLEHILLSIVIVAVVNVVFIVVFVAVKSIV